MKIIKIKVINYKNDIDELIRWIEDSYKHKTGKYLKISCTNNSNSKIANFKLLVEDDFDMKTFEESVKFNTSYCRESDYKITVKNINL